ncbi:hypothetical protein L484_023656 [Morus notabilis]|uniref:Uncharacterized protein n=1 Tax=Morus notabilis TaxID=981085 RepID=W9RS39_9ROSA|nr:hypothetical protein L484_023656 [Morus notabilis]
MNQNTPTGPSTKSTLKRIIYLLLSQEGMDSIPIYRSPSLVASVGLGGLDWRWNERSGKEIYELKHRSMMKTGHVLIAIVTTSLCVQSDAKRLLLEEVNSGNKENSIQNSTATNDDNNESYGNSSNPSGSTTDSHHVYTSGCKIKSPC